jgi:shikimate dehydrogenase
VVLPLLRAGVVQLVIANRTPERAVQLAEHFATSGPVHALGAAGAALPRHCAGFDLIVNATAASSAGELPEVRVQAVGEGTLAYDMAYAQVETPFLQWARKAGASRQSNGLGMLVEQAAESFLLWRGVRPDTAPVLAALRAPPGSAP